MNQHTNSANERLTLYQGLEIYLLWYLWSFLIGAGVALLLAPIGFVYVTCFKDSTVAEILVVICTFVGLGFFVFYLKTFFHKTLVRNWKHFRIEFVKGYLSWGAFLKFMFFFIIFVGLPTLFVGFLGTILERAFYPEMVVKSLISKSWYVSLPMYIVQLLLLSLCIRWFIGKHPHLYRVRQLANENVIFNA